MIDAEAVWLSVRLAAATSAVLVVLGMPLAWWLARSRRRWRPLVEAVVALPLVLPPTVLGFYLLVAMGPNGPRCMKKKSLHRGHRARLTRYQEKA